MIDTHIHSLCKDSTAEVLSSAFALCSSSDTASCSVNRLLLESGRDRLHDLLGLDLIVDLQGEQVSGGSQLELCDAVSLVLLDSDLLSAGQALLLSAHDLDELLQILDFLGLKNIERSERDVCCLPCLSVLNL